MSVHSLRHLAADMDVLATDTWHKLADGDQARIKFREDSITDHNLLALHRIHGNYLSVLRYNQREEASSGADWEWWMGSDLDGWFVLRIQAKRAHGLKYAEVGHKNRTTRQLQYQTLLDGCLTTTAYPFHVFYNGWERDRFKEHQTIPAGPPWWSKSFAQAASEWGCMAVATSDVRDLHTSVKRQKYYVPRYLARGFPWSDLFSGMSAGLMGTALVDQVQFNAFRASQGSATSTAWLAQGMTLGDLIADSQVRRDAVGRDSRMRRLPAYAEAARALGVSNWPPDAVDAERVGGRSFAQVPRRVTVTDLSN